MKGALLLLLLAGCGSVRYHLQDEKVTLVSNSDDPSAPPPSALAIAQAPTVDAQATGFCLLTFSGERPFALWYWRGASGRNCWIHSGARAVATLIILDGQTDFEVLNLRWTP